MPSSWDPARTLPRYNKLLVILKFIRIEHTLFSLPFAYLGALYASRLVSFREIILIFLAVLGLRIAAMSYNNIADLDIDRLNPRTKSRPLVTGLVSLKTAWIVVLVGSMLYFFSAYLLNIYAFILSPALWVLAISYPYAKRIHWLPHLHLGFVLGMVIFGGYVAVEGIVTKSISSLVTRAPWFYVLAVASWVAGFDTYYAILDLEFDRKHNIGSLPSRFGEEKALIISRLFHAMTIVFLMVAARIYKVNLPGYLAITLFTIITLYQHIILSYNTRENIPRAFNTNLFSGPILSLGLILDKLFTIYYF